MEWMNEEPYPGPDEHEEPVPVISKISVGTGGGGTYAYPVSMPLLGSIQAGINSHSSWVGSNPISPAGFLYIVTTGYTGKMGLKVSDGMRPFTSLPWIGEDPGF